MNGRHEMREVLVRIYKFRRYLIVVLYKSCLFTNNLYGRKGMEKSKFNKVVKIFVIVRSFGNINQ